MESEGHRGFDFTVPALDLYFKEILSTVREGNGRNMLQDCGTYVGRLNGRYTGHVLSW